MAKMNSYSADSTPSISDKFLVTDSTTGKTKNLYLNDAIWLTNNVNGISRIQLIFNNLNPNIIPEPGYFYADNSKTNPLEITKLILNKEALYKLNLTELWNKLALLPNIVLKLENPENLNNFFNFKIKSIGDQTDIFVIDVELYKNLYSGELLNDTVYSVYFDVKENFEDKTDKGGYVGTAKDLDDKKQDKTEKGAANGYVPLGSDIKIASQYLKIVNDLVTGGAGALLSAEQGKSLKSQIDAINTLLVSDNINLDTVQEIVDAIEMVQTSLSTILVNDLTSGGSTKALSAEQGKILQTTKEDTSNKTGDIAGNLSSVSKFAHIKGLVDWINLNVKLAPYLGSIIPSSTPTGTGAAYWIAVQNGTYTSFGSLVVNTNSIAVISRDSLGAFSISQTAFDLSGYLSKIDLTNNTGFTNLFPNSNYGLILTKIAGVLAIDNLPVAGYQTGTPVATALSNFEGFNSALKVTLKVGDRLNFLSPLLSTNALTINNTIKFNAGFYLKVPAAFTGTVDIYLIKTTGTINVNISSDVEFVQLGNDWRYYRLKQGVIVNPTDGFFHVGVYLNNISGSVTSDLYLAAPAILRTNTTITPGIYNGIDTIKDYSQFLAQSDLNAVYLNNYDIEGNLLLDHKFSKQTNITIGTSPWFTSNGNSSISFPAVNSISNIVTPIGNTSLLAAFSKRSSDSKFTDSQLYQGFIVPTDLRSNTVWSFGFWMKRDTLNVSLSNVAQQYYSNENYTGGLATTSTAPTITNETVGNWVFVKYNNVQLPVGTKAIVIFLRAQYTGATLDAITNLYITGVTVNMRSGVINSSSQNQRELTSEIVAPLLPVGTPLNYNDLYELNNNQFKDAIFMDQTIGSTAFTGLNWAMTFGGASRYKGNYSIIAMDSPVGNSVLAIDVVKRSSDGFSTDNQVYQGILIPMHLRGRVATCSFGFWMKRVSSVSLIAAVATAYSDELFTTAITNASHTATVTNEIIGNWVFVKVNNIPLPTNAKAISLTARASWNPAIATPLDTIYKMYLTGFVVDFTGNPLLGYTRNTDEKIAFAVGNSGGTLARLKGKKWCSFGDSITAANLYQIPVINRYGLIHYLRGIGGSGVSLGSQIAWVDANGLYITRPPASAPAGTAGVDYFEILSQGYQQQRVNTIPTDTNIITIMFGANDYSLPLGTIDDTSSENTFYGKYQQMLDLIYIRIPNAEKVLLTPTFLSYETTGFIDLKREAIFKIGKKYAYRVIDVGGECGINKNNSTVYLSDGIHPNGLGNNRMSVPLINDFIKIYG